MFFLFSFFDENLDRTVSIRTRMCSEDFSFFFWAKHLFHSFESNIPSLTLFWISFREVWNKGRRGVHIHRLCFEKSDDLLAHWILFLFLFREVGNMGKGRRGFKNYPFSNGNTLSYVDWVSKLLGNICFLTPSASCDKWKKKMKKKWINKLDLSTKSQKLSFIATKNALWF